MKKSLILFFCLSCSICFSQDENLRYIDTIYQEEIQTVKFHVSGYLVSMPILFNGSGNSLRLSFDDVSGDDAKNYVYSVVHCNADWTPSRLTEFEYVDGFSEKNIEDFDYSFKAKSIYTHYWVNLPNEDMAFTKSGNYLLKVYEDEDEKILVLTRRFVIVDEKVNLVPRMVRPAMVSKNKTHHEIDFRVQHSGFEIRNPRQELNAMVIQNGRWNTAITGLKPLFSRFDEQNFDYQNKVVFPAGKEFRYLDLRGLRYKDPKLVSVTIDDNGKYEAEVGQEKKRGGMAHFERFDINGNFIIENADERGRLFSRRPSDSNVEITLNEQIELQRQEEIFGEDNLISEVNNLQSEYVDVLFKLYSPGKMYGEDLYIFGGLSDWQFKPRFKMVYNPAVSAYVAKIRLKQGYYDYLYAARPQGKDEADFEVTEGDWYETENEYTILVYYRPFGGRYDQLIGMETFSSRD